MLQSLHDQLNDELEALRKAGKFKRLRHVDSPMAPHVAMDDSRQLFLMCSNNYLGLAAHPEVIEAGQRALARYGAGTASVRFICGTFTVHRQLEDTLSSFFGTQAALTYVSCWNANEGTIPTVAGPEDALISDRLNHASLIDACRLAGKTARYIYEHSDMASLEARLREASSARRKIILTDGVFSMEGDCANLPDIVTLAEKYGAAVLVDDSHGHGVMGPTGRGTAEHFGLMDKIDITTGTLGKAFGGAAGGFVASSDSVIETLVQMSRPQIFSNALPPTVAASAMQALRVLDREPERVEQLQSKVKLFRDGLRRVGFDPLEGPSAIIPIMIGETAQAIRMSRMLYDEGIYVIGFGYPVVPEGAARVRVQICATMSEEDLEGALPAFEKVGKELGIV